MTGEHCWVHKTAEEKGRRYIYENTRAVFDVHPVLTHCRQQYSFVAVLVKVTPVIVVLFMTSVSLSDTI